MKVFTADGSIQKTSLNSLSVSRLLFDSMALSAWNSVEDVSWPLRVNPSSGNLHPTEWYLLCGSIPELCPQPMVRHYAQKEHGLEVRTEIAEEVWENSQQGCPGEQCYLTGT